MTRYIDPRYCDWMHRPDISKIMDVLGNARFVGGAVRDSLLGLPIKDIDLATPSQPDIVIAKLKTAGIKVIPTGLEHGTVTAVCGNTSVEITALRRDIQTDGRHATVEFTVDWEQDAARRDFTMNALYADQFGVIYDYFGGAVDAIAGTVRFVGDPMARIREDYLRILRLFRFHAWYGYGPMDMDALKAATRLRDGLAKISGERIQKELFKTLESPDPIHAIRLMRVSGVLGQFIPGEIQMDSFERLVDNGETDIILRLASLIGEIEAAKYVTNRLRFSKKDRDRLEKLIGTALFIGARQSPEKTKRQICQHGKSLFRDQCALYRAAEMNEDYDADWHLLMDFAEKWSPPEFPINGDMIIAGGVKPGKIVGAILADIKEWWMNNNFPVDSSLVAYMQSRIRFAMQTLALEGSV